ncbi:regulatory protein RecX [Tenacibaculum jejuense]|uniref:Regulatory protein RecX n=1 Tax=Tenacibaculum jejuense TaxID=584609 RepID=A0A238U7D1_9FLAO|nr:regulatory protein RecX [Tenacibaculum jejuense]SNR14290.1 Regulatory protein RecX [Tenacibaculum jejuense]
MNKQSVVTVDEVKRKLERFCVYQDRCHKEVEDKLRGFHLIPEARELILLHLLEHDFLNEERFSRSFARGKFRIKNWGKVRITRELKLRDISVYNIKQALSEIDEEEYFSKLNSLAERKISSTNESNSFKKRKKVFDYLNYRGYEINLINEVLNELLK